MASRPRRRAGASSHRPVGLTVTAFLHGVSRVGTLPTDATFMTGRFERQTGVAESFAPHVLQGKGFLLCTQFVHPFRGLMRDSRFP